MTQGAEHYAGRFSSYGYDRLLTADLALTLYSEVAAKVAADFAVPPKPLPALEEAIKKNTENNSGPKHPVIVARDTAYLLNQPGQTTHFREMAKRAATRHALGEIVDIACELAPERYT